MNPISAQIKQSQREGGVNKSKKQGTFAVEVSSNTGMKTLIDFFKSGL